MGTPEFALPSLNMLVEEGYEIAAVVTQPDKPKGRGNKLCCPPVKEYADKKGLLVLQPEKVKTQDFINQIRNLEPDLLVTAAYGKILPADLLDIPRYGCINVHASLLPKYRGAAPINWAIINGETQTGITTMQTDAGMDTGDILLKSEIEISRDITAGELEEQLAELGAETLKNTLLKIKEGNLHRTPQQDSEASYAPMLRKELGLINWGKTSGEIHNLVRGTNPWPGAYTFYKGRRIKIWKTRNVENWSAECSNQKLDKNSILPGTICSRTKDGIVVKCGVGYILLLEFQFDGGKKLCTDACWHNFDTGAIFSETGNVTGT
jgi:methionyl-tRNA formyltransferase